ncbi:hypothetical protein [Mycolicibacterium brumae]|uniref:Uncharacterized protein n=1 Tax=Mycolicibacterium brumae TaxID=85968 RepID=A0A2G5P469_9MYCO|nr:hypothetical protein [Mycolicibacterium brumae]MCV7194152.1 hypothetical protein [Mycolicibacterium brumae]PIB73198.1 hypothetical protein CQY22_017910 [Mycolicibacterium brumae]RWA22674.1 hypothetical protein MBRU_12040 [Mycolicibacterium brumae DSM 44177]UWW07520.1 hypothetical protein L2Z93_000537 [Mycolicibacterium brumae]
MSADGPERIEISAPTMFELRPQMLQLLGDGWRMVRMDKPIAEGFGEPVVAVFESVDEPRPGRGGGAVTVTERAGFPPPSTVAELRQLLDQLPEDALVLVDGYEAAFAAIVPATDFLLPSTGRAIAINGARYCHQRGAQRFAPYAAANGR